MGGSSREAAPLQTEGGISAIAPERSGWSRFRREQATLGRVGGLMREEMAALAPGSWALWRLGSDLTGDGWGALVLPELAALLRDEDAVSARAHTCRERCPSGADRVVLRRLGALMRTEAAGLAAWGSPLARRLECWGIRLVLDCDCPQRPSPPPRRAARSRAGTTSQSTQVTTRRTTDDQWQGG